MQEVAFFKKWGAFSCVIPHLMCTPEQFYHLSCICVGKGKIFTWGYIWSCTLCEQCQIYISKSSGKLIADAARSALFVQRWFWTQAFLKAFEVKQRSLHHLRNILMQTTSYLIWTMCLPPKSISARCRLYVAVMKFAINCLRDDPDCTNLFIPVSQGPIP